MSQRRGRRAACARCGGDGARPKESFRAWQASSVVAFAVSFVVCSSLARLAYAEKAQAPSTSTTSAATPPAVEVPKSVVDGLVVRARGLDLADHPMWWRLLHYESTLLGAKSEADGAWFFLAPDGKSNPEAELEATIRGFFGPEPDDEEAQHPFCRFPARLAWLHSKLGFDWSVLPKRACPRLQEFRQRMRADAVTLVFSSYYLNTPASAFGHSFMRLHKRARPGETETEDLLDYGIDFSATVDTDNALLYAIKGLTGLFPGTFSKRPYYFKVREYNDFEARDIWEYELDLSQREVDMAVAHIWELGSTYFDYYYLTENCSYHMLGILEVARPGLDLRGQLGWPVVPIDTIKAVAETPGLVRSISYRPSVRSQFEYRLDQLDGDEVEAVVELADDVDAPLSDALTREQQIRALDVAIDLIDVRHAEDLLDPNTEGSRLKNRLLSRRAALGGRSSKLRAPPRPNSEPTSGHDSGRIGLGSGYDSQSGLYYDASFRLALHDLSDPSGGYPNELAISFLSMNARYRLEERRATFEDLSLVSIHSLSPQNQFDRALAWNFRVGGTRLRDEGCDDCFAGLIEVGGGAAFAAADSKALLFLHANTRVVGAPDLEGGIADSPVRAGIGPLGGLRLAPTENLTFLVEGSLHYLPVQSPLVMWDGRASIRYQYRTNFTWGAVGQIQAEGFSAGLVSSIYY